MEDVAIIKHDETIMVCFYIENTKPFEIGEKIGKINERAYMNGYNWEVFLDYYLDKNAPEIIKEMDTDSEAGMYAAYFEETHDNEILAEKFAGIIRNLLENEEEIYRIVRENGDEIEWD